MEQRQQTSEPKPCSGGCGFYGSAAFSGYCSKCHKAIAANATPSLCASTEAPRSMEALSSSALGGSAVAASPVAPPPSGLPLATPAGSSAEAGAPSTAIAAAAAPSAPPAAPTKLDMGASSSSSSAVGAAAEGDVDMGAWEEPAAQGSSGATALLSALRFDAPATPAPAPAVVSTPPRPAAPGPATTAPGDAPAAAADAPAGGDEEKGGDEGKVQKNKGRCWGCKKKVGLTGFECRCGFVFCGVHRYADQHGCAFDYASFDKANLARLNQKVVGDKLASGRL